MVDYVRQLFVDGDGFPSIGVLRLTSWFDCTYSAWSSTYRAVWKFCRLGVSAAMVITAPKRDKMFSGIIRVTISRNLSSEYTITKIQRKGYTFAYVYFTKRYEIN